MMEGVEFDQAHRLGEAMDNDGGEYDAGFDLPADFDAAFLQFSTDFSIPETDLFDGLGLGSDYVTGSGAGDGSGSDESVRAVPVARKGKSQATATSANASTGPNAGSSVPPPTGNASTSGPIAGPAGHVPPASGPSSGPGSHASQNTAGDTPTTPMTGGAFELQPLLSERESFAFSNFLDKVLQDPMIDPKETDELFPFMDPSIQPPQMHLGAPPALSGHPGPAMHPGAHPQQHQPPLPPNHHMGPPTPGIGQAPTPTGMHMGGGDSGPSTPASGMGPIPGTPDELRLRVPSIAFDTLRQQQQQQHQNHQHHQHQHQQQQHGMTPPSPGMSGQFPPHMMGPQHHPYQPSASEQIHLRAMAETLGQAGVIDGKPPTPGHLAPHISELMSRPLDAQQQAHMRRVSASSVSTVSSAGVAQMPQMAHPHHPQMTPGGMQSPSPGAGPMPMPPHHPQLHATHPGMPGSGPSPSPVQAQVQAQMPGQPQPASRTPNRATSASRTPGAQNGSGKKREVLTPAQKRKNHVDSEKRRRDLIRTHFEEMCKLVPRLNEGPDSAAAAKSKSTVLFMVYDHLVFLTERNKMIRKLLVANGVNASHIPDAVSAST